MDALPRLTAEQTAERLGVKLETLYAYVARGRLGRERTADGSSFDPLEVERFAASRRRRPPADAGRSEGRPLMVIETDFASIEDGGLRYRGRPVDQLAAEPFETVAHWALTGAWDATARFEAGAGLDAARAVAVALPAAAGDRDRQLVAVSAFAAADPLRASLDPVVVASAAERLVAGMVEVLPRHADAAPDLPSRLFARLAPRASPYGVVVAGLGALDSPLHGNASRAAHRLLERVVSGADPARAVADAVVTTHGPVPGFGQPLYPDGDPRARILLGMIADDPRHAAVTAAVRAVCDVVRERTGAHPNVDLALGAVTLALGMRDDAGEVVFATARTVGWIVHAIDEYAQRPLRLRPVGRYTGP